MRGRIAALTMVWAVGWGSAGATRNDLADSIPLSVGRGWMSRQWWRTRTISVLVWPWQWMRRMGDRLLDERDNDPDDWAW